MAQVYVGEDLVAVWLADALAVGQETCPRTVASGASFATPTLSTGVLNTTHFTARKTETSTQVRMYTAGTAAAATPSLCRIGLYRWDLDPVTGVRSATLIASTANDTALFAAAFTGYTRSWSAPVAVTAGQRYVLGVLVVTAAAAPTMVGQAMVGGVEAAVTPRLSGLVGGLSDLPATYLESSLAGAATRCYGAILP